MLLPIIQTPDDDWTSVTRVQAKSNPLPALEDLVIRAVLFTLFAQIKFFMPFAPTLAKHFRFPQLLVKGLAMIIDVVFL